MHTWLVFYSFVFVIGMFLLAEQTRFRKAKKVIAAEFLTGLGQVMMFASALAAAFIAASHVLTEEEAAAEPAQQQISSILESLISCAGAHL